MLNLKHLYYYNVFTQELSTTKAAKRLRITPPALCNQLKQLEEFVGAKLTRRVNGKVVITEHGELVRHYANRMFSTYEDLKTKLSDSRDLRNTHFRVGISQYVGARFAFDLLFLIEKSNLMDSQKVHITFGSFGRLQEGFMKDEFDLVIGGMAGEFPAESNCIAQQLIFPVRLFAPKLLVAGMSRDAKREQLGDLTKIIELANAKNIALALPMQPSYLRKQTDELLATVKIAPIRTIESNGSKAIVEFIERGFAFAFVATPCLLDFKLARELLVLGPAEGYWNHEISVLIHKSEQKPAIDNSKLAQILSVPAVAPAG